MTTDFTNDKVLGEHLRAEIPAPGDEYWEQIARTLGTANPDADPVETAQPIDVTDEPVVVPFRSRLRGGFGGAAALAVAAALLVIVGVMVGTRVQRSGDSVNSGFAQDPASVVTDPIALEALPGPTKNRDHWNAVYGVWDCTANNGQGDWVPKFDSTEDDVGIHSHDNGLISIHPFFDESAGRNATFSHFADSMNFELTDTSIIFDDGQTMLEGTVCGEQKAVVQLRRWQSDGIARTETVLAPRIITENLNNERFYNDREVWILALAPLDADIPLPPPERFEALTSLSNAIEYAPVGALTPWPVESSTMRMLDADVARTLGSPPEPVIMLPSNEPTTVFTKLIREPRPEWTDIIVEDTFRPIATATLGSDPDVAVVLASYQIALEDGTTRACVAIIDVEAQQISGSSYCHPNSNVAPSSLIIEEWDSYLFMRNTPADAAYLVAETVSGTRIATNPVERHAYVGWDFVTDRIAELTFYNSALQPIVTCPRPTDPIEPECLQTSDN